MLAERQREDARTASLGEDESLTNEMLDGHCRPEHVSERSDDLGGPAGSELGMEPRASSDDDWRPRGDHLDVDQQWTKVVADRRGAFLPARAAAGRRQGAQPRPRRSAPPPHHRRRSGSPPRPPDRPAAAPRARRHTGRPVASPRAADPRAPRGRARSARTRSGRCPPAPPRRPGQPTREPRTPRAPAPALSG